MAIIIPKDVLKEIQIEANLPDYHTFLLRLDPNRFRGLGEENREKFIRHIDEYCDKINIDYQDDAIYIMFISTFLGSYFYEDFRYIAISNELENIHDGYDPRIDNIREKFIEIGKRFIGKDREYYLNDIKYFHREIVPIYQKLTPDQMIHAITRCHDNRSYNMQKPYHDKLLYQAQIAAKNLKFSSENGLKISIALCYWLGMGFWKDPLFPWVNEQAIKGGEEAVLNYALHRLNRQIMING